MEDILRLGVALAIGLLVGLERGWRERDEPAGSRTAGLRTFGIFGLLGGVFAAIGAAMDAPGILAAGFLGFALLFGMFQFHKARHDGNFSATGLMAGLGVFGLGALAVAGDYRVAAAGGAALAAVLGSREILHRALRKLTWIELRSALVLTVMTTIILPILPNRAIDPWGGLNPREIWLFTVLVAGISFIGYIAVRVLGPTRGLLMSGLAGALVSSTAVTAALARIAHDGGRARPLAGTASLAGAVSILRVIVVVLMLAPDFLLPILPAALTGAAVLTVAGMMGIARAASAEDAGQTVRNPFELRVLLAFAAMFALVSTVSAVLVSEFGSSSLLAAAGFSALFDVDVAVLSALRLSGQIDRQLITATILLALAANACGRLLLAVLSGPPRFWLPLLAAKAAAVAAGAAVYLSRISA